MLGWDFYKALRANDTMIVQGHQQVFSTVQQGERVIGAEGADPRTYADGREVPNQRMIYPTEGVFIVSSPTAVIKGAAHHQGIFRREQAFFALPPQLHGLLPVFQIGNVGIQN
jgi:iron(III) transport system substrate-binding protein